MEVSCPLVIVPGCAGTAPPPTMSYTAKIVRLNADADSSLLGVQLGRLCIHRRVPVADVAEALNVTKAAVYRWFSGKRDVSKHLRERVLAYYRSTLPPA